MLSTDGAAPVNFPIQVVEPLYFGNGGVCKIAVGRERIRGEDLEGDERSQGGNAVPRITPPIEQPRLDNRIAWRAQVASGQNVIITE